MYSDKAQLTQLVALLRAHGLKAAVLCAGSRSAPLVHSLASCPDIVCRAAGDERRAAFPALGLAQALGAPTALCVTSGSALLDAAPAVAEAYYQQIPLVVVSADRPEAWIDQMDGQTLRQARALRDFTRREVSLPLGESPEELWHGARRVNEALMAAGAPVPGPVHINLPLAEPLFGFTREELPRPKVMRRERPSGIALSPEALAEWSSASRVLVLAGQLPPGHGLEAWLQPLRDRGALVLAEQLANLEGLEHAKGLVSRRFDLALALGAEPPAPDLVVSLGGHVVSKRLKRYLRSRPGLSHWQLAMEPADTYQRLTRLIPCRPHELFRALPQRDFDPAFAGAWREAEERAERRRAAISQEGPGLTSLSAMGRILSRLPKGCSLQLANSTPLRDAQIFSPPRGARIFCNRGVNGIDGSLSTALGYAQEAEGPVFCLIGDLSLFYDLGALRSDALQENHLIIL